MKIETRFIYFSIDKDGFHLEIGNIDKPTSLLVVSYMRNWWRD